MENCTNDGDPIGAIVDVVAVGVLAALGRNDDNRHRRRHPVRHGHRSPSRRIARAPVIGVYRFWRDSGYVVGRVVAGGLAAAIDFAVGLWVALDLPIRAGPAQSSPREAPRAGVGAA